MTPEPRGSPTENPRVRKRAVALAIGMGLTTAIPHTVDLIKEIFHGQDSKEAIVRQEYEATDRIARADLIEDAITGLVNASDVANWTTYDNGMFNDPFCDDDDEAQFGGFSRTGAERRAQDYATLCGNARMQARQPWHLSDLHDWLENVTSSPNAAFPQAAHLLDELGRYTQQDPTLIERFMPAVSIDPDAKVPQPIIPTDYTTWRKEDDRYICPLNELHIGSLGEGGARRLQTAIQGLRDNIVTALQDHDMSAEPALDALANNTGDAFVNNLQTLTDYELAIEEKPADNYFGFTGLSDRGVNSHRRAREGVAQRAKDRLDQGYDGDLTAYISETEANDPVLASAKAMQAAKSKLANALSTEWQPQSRKPSRWKIWKKKQEGVINPVNNTWILAENADTIKGFYRRAIEILDEKYTSGSQMFPTEDQAILFSTNFAMNESTQTKE
ncbi:hypothetical protein HN592_02190 [Candidatus Woesearchaeota archaeon]|jgi:hypothetical protein|nr:hypothetical protein [Candidatus Woesearchaeota archaeon]MBT4368022.1 hypothetical protein [Candidatus Woesearchaeota archaeon]MBT4712510.1 hypothetical protein [Candidatus Woesearchaeota archaeon]MBT6639423.1 hypothetical protein [Candidatus Woesearchaeota archaeon]MBT7133595.1 hypothetical protein [Candidatus Woesearchaeota archaeon]